MLPRFNARSLFQKQNLTQLIPETRRYKWKLPCITEGRRSAVVKRVEHISTIVFVNI